MSDSDEWEDRIATFNEKPTRTAARGIRHVWLLVLLVLALAAVTGIAVWTFNVVTSGVKGEGDAQIIKNEAKNRIRAQEGFEDKYAAIVTADQNINLTADALKLSPQSEKLSIELTGQKMICNDLVGRYNAAARKFTQGEFRDAELPPAIGTADVPANEQTDCKENTK